MRLVSFREADAAIGTGAIVGDGADARVVALDAAIASLELPADRREALAVRGIAVPAGGIMRLLAAGPDAMAAIARLVATHAAAHAAGGDLRRLADVALLAPVPRPGKIVAVGRNYADHAKETGVDPFETPRIIAKLPSSVVGPGARVQAPSAVAKFDFEAELAVVIGAFARDVAIERALDVVAGYTALNDLSAREFQFDITPPQTTFAKSMDGFCPMGPWLVTRDAIADPQKLEVACWVNGTRMQHASTADMIFPVARLIAYVSTYMTLEPGDVLATGTPAGIGAFRKPPVWLRPGDRVRVDVSGIGALETEIA